MGFGFMFVRHLILYLKEYSIQSKGILSMSAEPFFDERSDRLKVNFKNEGKGSASLIDVQAFLKFKSGNQVLQHNLRLQSLGAGSTAEEKVLPQGVQAILSKFDTLSHGKVWEQMGGNSTAVMG
jgi:hypothetical protein